MRPGAALLLLASCTCATPPRTPEGPPVLPTFPIEPAPGYVVDGRAPFRLSAPVPSPDGSRVAVIAGHSYQDEEIWVWTPADDRLVNLTRSFGRRSTYARIVWAPDGQLLAAPLHPLGDVGQQLALLPVDGGAEVDVGVGTVAELAWSPDGQRLVFADGNRIHVVHRRGGERVTLGGDGQLGIQDLVFWDGGIAYVAGWLLEEKQVWLAPLAGGPPTRLTREARFGRLARAGDELAAYRLGDEPALGTEELRIRPGTHEVRLAGRTPEYMNPLQSSTPVLSLGAQEATVAGRTLLAARVETLQRGERLADARRRFAERPLALVPDARAGQPARPVRLPRRPLPLHDTTVVARRTLAPSELERALRIGPVELELGTIVVEPAGEGEVAVRVDLRFGDRVGEAYLGTAQPASLPLALQELWKPPAPAEQGSVSGHYRAYMLGVEEIEVDPATGLWSSLTLALWRYDEVTGVPQIESVGLGEVEPTAGESLPGAR